MLVHHDHGGTGPVLLLLHANGFHGMAYLPLIECTKESFRCISIDLPGQGNSWMIPCSQHPDSICALVKETIISLGLKGCFCFGHSLGAGIALALQYQDSAMFSAIFVFEPVIRAQAPSYPSPPTSPANARHNLPHPTTTTTTTTKSAAEPTTTTTATSPTTPTIHPPTPTPTPPPNTLHTMALRRRRNYPSFQAAIEHLQRKPPFSTFHPQSLHAYIHYGLHYNPPTNPPDTLTLKCTPETEAAVYAACSPPPSVPPSQITCPVMISIGEQTLESIHSNLVVNARELVAGLPYGRLVVFTGCGHFGPFVRPEAVADTMCSFFGGVLEGRKDGGPLTSSL